MSALPFTVIPERPHDAAAVDSLHERAFGPGRFAKAAYRLREGVPHEPGLSFVALAGGSMIGSVRLTGILVGDHPALLLGPLAVEPAWAGRGAGRALVRTALAVAAEAGHAAVILVGDEAYYGPLGFRRTDTGALTLPAPADPARILIAPLSGMAADLHGMVRRKAPQPTADG